MDVKEPRQPRKRPLNEFCEIEPKLLRKSMMGASDWVYWGNAVGPRGFYSAGESPSFQFKGAKYELAKEGPGLAAINALIQKLYMDGWQTVGIGRSWWDLKFRRGVPEG